MSPLFAKTLTACVLALATAGTRLAQAQFADAPEKPSAAKPAAKLPPGKTGAWAPPADALIVPGFWSLGIKSVQKEVGLSTEQKARLKEISDAYQSALRQAYGQIQDLPPPEQQEKAAEVREQARQLMLAAHKKAAAALAPQQAAAVRKIDLQLQAADVANRERGQLGLTGEQLQRLRQVLEESQEKMQQLQRDMGGRVLEILTPEQVEQLQQQTENWRTRGSR